MDAGVRAWLEERTYSSAQWTADELVDLKGGSTVTIVLPARNEAGTVGRIVSTLRRDLVQRAPLVDELLVVDAGSTDGTAAVAEAAGARVVRQCDVLPELGDRPGKGEALWKSLHVTSGDVVAFIDADLRQFDSQFAVGLLGPLLTDPPTQFVKAFYDRPLVAGGTILPAGGGRVTEILARPLINLHWPELAGFVQPLAGEYAARRDLLEAIPFLSGYGVEIAMLVDVVGRVGLDAMAQVDLGLRVHRNSSDAVLGRMACEVYLAALSRVRGCDPADLDEAHQAELVQYLRSDERFTPRSTSIEMWERPPARRVGRQGHRDRTAAERAARP